MTSRASLAAHAVAAFGLLFLVIAGSSVGTVDSLLGWLLGRSALSSRYLPHVLIGAAALAILLRGLACQAREIILRWSLGGGLIGFLLAVLACSHMDLAPILGLSLVIAGLVGGWVLAPRNT